MAESNLPVVCLFNKFGFCKFSLKCRKMHTEEICDVRTCSLRHPKICKYFAWRGFCKFGDFCRFKHNRIDNLTEKGENLVKENKEMEKEIIDLKNGILLKELKIENLKTEKERILKENEEKEASLIECDDLISFKESNVAVEVDVSIQDEKMPLDAPTKVSDLVSVRGVDEKCEDEKGKPLERGERKPLSRRDLLMACMSYKQ